MVSLSDFLVQRIAEDEATARIEHVGREWRVDEEGCCVLVGHKYDPDVETHSNGTADHIARHDPARVLAECDAKRRIVEHLNAGPVYVGTFGTVVPSASDFVPGEPGVTRSASYVLALLALPFAAHPDYREEWKP